MKTIHNVPKPKCYFCPLFKKWFCAMLRTRRSKCSDRFDLVLRKLEDIEDTIEIIARQIARWSKIEPGE
jgi:hypothetical protein